MLVGRIGVAALVLIDLQTSKEKVDISADKRELKNLEVANLKMVDE